MTLHEAIDRAVSQIDQRLLDKIDKSFFTEDLAVRCIEASINISSGRYTWDDIKLVIQVVKNVAIPLQVQQQVNRLQALKGYSL